MRLLDVVKLGVEGLHDRMDMIYFGMVLQKNLLFSGTVAENLRMAAPMADDNALWAVLKQVRLADFLRSENGLDTQLNAVLAQMRTDGTLEQILGKYLEHASQYLEVDTIGT